ncbi:MAG: NifU family protein [Cytophagales bacterium]|nr:NifU family protein [Cytophagales bacterium]
MENQTLLEKLNTALDNIRPYLEADGGDVKIVEIIDEKEVVLELLGTCSSCSMSTMTMKAGIEQAIKRAVPEITEVRALNVTPPQV